jgi:DNA-binding XRE family transcriptional regulator
MDMDQIFLQFGHLVRQGRQNMGLSQHEMAQLLEIRQATVSAIEHGKANPRMDMMLQIMDLLHLPPPWQAPTQGDPYADMVIPEDSEPDHAAPNNLPEP